MYLEFLRALTLYIAALNEASDKTDDDSMTPYVQFVPVIIYDDLCGFINDEVGGAYSYEEATEAERIWWSYRPGARTC